MSMEVRMDGFKVKYVRVVSEYEKNLSFDYSIWEWSSTSTVTRDIEVGMWCGSAASFLSVV